jgi:hypothetical protein
VTDAALQGYSVAAGKSARTRYVHFSVVVSWSESTSQPTYLPAPNGG